MVRESAVRYFLACIGNLHQLGMKVVVEAIASMVAAYQRPQIDALVRANGVAVLVNHLKKSEALSLIQLLRGKPKDSRQLKH